MLINDVFILQKGQSKYRLFLSFIMYLFLVSIRPEVCKFQKYHFTPNGDFAFPFSLAHSFFFITFFSLFSMATRKKPKYSVARGSQVTHLDSYLFRQISIVIREEGYFVFFHSHVYVLFTLFCMMIFSCLLFVVVVV